ncbi:MAG TPA: MFS transporter [Steroidobacteraceae bacterium]|nr:MFS transporter [Steroidobacteraceae bacterium]
MNVSDQSGALPKATRKEWLGLAVIAVPCLLYSMDLNVLNLAIPHLTAELQPTSTQLLWIVDIYGFLLAGFLITMGTLGDRIGRRKLLMIGAVAFGAASVLAAFATTAEMLIAARAILGIAAATLAPSTLSLIRNMFLDAGERTTAIGIWVGCFSAGSVVGPIVGGILLEQFWWGSVFLIAVPLMALLLILAPLLLPEYRDPNAGKMDVQSAMLATAAVLSMTYGAKHIAVYGPETLALVSVSASLVIGTLFVRRQRGLSDPMIDLRLFQRPIFTAALCVNIIGIFAAFGSFLFVTQYLQLVRGMGPLEAGIWLVPCGIIFMIGAFLAPIMVKRFLPGTVLTWGFALTAIGYAILTQINVDGELWIAIVGIVLFCSGLAPMGTLTTDLVMSDVPPERAGAASGISETSFEFGAALGVAVLGSVVSAVYRTQMSDADLAGLTGATLDNARETLGAAVAAAETLGDHARDNVLLVARTSFTQAMNVAAWVSTVLAIVASIVCFRFMRHQRIATH